MKLQQFKSRETRQKLVMAAREALQTHSLSGLTLNNVAQLAQVSKGGLLHHFPTKDALLEAVLQELLESFAARVEHFLLQEAPRPGCLLRAYIRATYEDEPPPLEIIMVLVTALNQNSTLLQMVQEDYKEWQNRLNNDGIPTARAAVVRQAADAYWNEQLMGIEQVNPATRQAIQEELLQLTEVSS
jgi:AcrR family transcriptional regulator